MTFEVQFEYVDGVTEEQKLSPVEAELAKAILAELNDENDPAEIPEHIKAIHITRAA